MFYYLLFYDKRIYVVLVVLEYVYYYWFEYCGGFYFVCWFLCFDVCVLDFGWYYVGFVCFCFSNIFDVEGGMYCLLFYVGIFLCGVGCGYVLFESVGYIGS